MAETVEPGGACAVVAVNCDEHCVGEKLADVPITIGGVGLLLRGAPGESVEGEGPVWTSRAPRFVDVEGAQVVL